MTGTSLAHRVVVGLLCALACLGVAGAARAAGGDRWVWPGPPDVDDPRLPSFYDPAGDRLVLVEQGWDGPVLWQFTPDPPRAWAPTPVLPSPRSRLLEGLLAYDPARNRVLAVEDARVASDTCCTSIDLALAWALDVGSGTWTSPVRGAPPLYHFGTALVFDSRRDRAVLLGGFASSTTGRTLSDSIQVLDASVDSAAWVADVIPGPALPVFGGYAAYDSLTDRVFVYGGQDSTGASRGGLHSLELGGAGGWESWTETDSAWSGFDNGFPRRMLLDPIGRRLLLVSGVQVAAGAGFNRDSVVVWQYDLAMQTGWTVLPYLGPSVDAYGAQAVFDSKRDLLWIYGGGGRDDMAALRLDGASAWTMEERSAQQPYLVSDTPVMWDRPHARALVLSQGALLWALQRGATDSWQSLPRTTPGPPGRNFPAAVYDTLRQRGFLFGGGDGELELGDLWRFTPNDSGRVAWEHLYPDGVVPAPRYGASVVLDPVRRRMVLFGGYTGKALADTWALPLDGPVRWQRLADRGLPPGARFLASAVYDSRRDAMIVYGGNSGTPNGRQLLNDTWILSFADGDVWAPVNTINAPPAPRFGHAAVYDPRRDRMLVFWGAAYNGVRFDCGELDLANGPTWNPYQPDGVSMAPHDYFNAVYDPDHDEALLLGGLASSSQSSSIFTYVLYDDFRANLVTSPPPLTGPPLALLGFAPNPTADIENIAFDLPTDAEVHARFYDAAGRLVRDLGPRHYVAGRHLLVWDGRNTLGARAASGVYYARVSALGKDFTGKFVLLH